MYVCLGLDSRCIEPILVWFVCRRADEEASAAARSLSDKADSQGRRRRRLPEGTSEYQASWIIESDEDDGEDDDDDEEEEEEDENNYADRRPTV